MADRGPGEDGSHGYRHGRRGKSLERFAAEVVSLMERALGMPLDHVHADRMPVPPRRVATVA